MGGEERPLMTKTEILRLTDLLGRLLDGDSPVEIDGRDRDVLSSVRHDLLDAVGE